MRTFPNPSTDTLTAFAFHSTRLERIPLSKQEIDQTLSGAKINPFMEGQLKACNLMTLLASTPNFIPDDLSPSPRISLTQLHFLKRFHTNLLKTAVEEAELKLDPDFMKRSDLGEWRQDRKFINSTPMPDPMLIPNHLHSLWNDLITFHNNIKHKIDNSYLLESQDLMTLSNKAYDVNLRLCCIKPFQDGSNRVARHVENTLRLYFGLPIKIIHHDTEEKMNYLNDIKVMQKNYL